MYVHKIIIIVVILIVVVIIMIIIVAPGALPHRPPGQRHVRLARHVPREESEASRISGKRK